jgi:hypothetical protein
MPNTTSITYGADTLTLNQITEGNNSSEYLYRDSYQEIRMKIRHSKEKAIGNAVPLDRHNVELTVRTFPTADHPLGKIESAYTVIRSDPNSNGAAAVLLNNALAAYTTAHAGSLVGWITTP